MRKVICLTPVKNEAWIIDSFLMATSMWADHIIIADQNSYDFTRDLALKYEKVDIFDNKEKKYNELSRQRMLIDYAREKYGNNNILIALDADEILVNFHDNPEWQLLHTLPESTSVCFPWLNVLPGNKEYFNSAGKVNLFAYIDDGVHHNGQEMHSLRVPSGNSTVTFNSIKILHYQYLFKDRQYAKHRWYECLEKIKYPNKSSLDIYRMYHHIDVVNYEKLKIDSSWFNGFGTRAIDIVNIQDDGFHWWNKEVCLMFEKYGASHFSKQYIWYFDWSGSYKKYLGLDKEVVYPGRLLDKLILKWLNKTQNKKHLLPIRAVDKLIRMSGW